MLIHLPKEILKRKLLYCKQFSWKKLQFDDYNIFIYTDINICSKLMLEYSKYTNIVENNNQLWKQ